MDFKHNNLPNSVKNPNINYVEHKNDNLYDMIRVGYAIS